MHVFCVCRLHTYLHALSNIDTYGIHRHARTRTRTHIHIYIYAHIFIYIYTRTYVDMHSVFTSHVRLTFFIYLA